MQTDSEKHTSLLRYEMNYEGKKIFKTCPKALSTWDDLLMKFLLNVLFKKIIKNFFMASSLQLFGRISAYSFPTKLPLFTNKSF